MGDGVGCTSGWPSPELALGATCWLNEGGQMATSGDFISVPFFV